MLSLNLAESISIEVPPKEDTPFEHGEGNAADNGAPKDLPTYKESHDILVGRQKENSEEKNLKRGIHVAKLVATYLTCCIARKKMLEALA